MSFDDKRAKGDRLFYVGALGISVAAFVQLLGVEKANIDRPLIIAIGCFAVAIPILAMGVALTTREVDYGSDVKGGELWLSSVGLIGLFVALVGLGALFWHFHVLIALLFAVVAIIAIILFFATVPKPPMSH
jgi:hypothetical protein